MFYAVLYLHFLLENDKLLKNELIFGYFIFDEIKKMFLGFLKVTFGKRFQKFDMGLAQNIPENSLFNVLLNNHQKKMKDFGA